MLQTYAATASLSFDSDQLAYVRDKEDIWQQQQSQPHFHPSRWQPLTSLSILIFELVECCVFTAWWFSPYCYHIHLPLHQGQHNKELKLQHGHSASDVAVFRNLHIQNGCQIMTKHKMAPYLYFFVFFQIRKRCILSYDTLYSISITNSYAFFHLVTN